MTGEEDTIPHEVVGLTVKKGMSLVRAWREYLWKECLKMTQEDAAEKAGISQPALAWMEKPGARPRKSTLEKLARAMGLDVEQLRV